MPTRRPATIRAASTLSFCDGSVRFIKNTIGLQIWWAIGTRNGNEVISSDQY